MTQRNDLEDWLAQEREVVARIEAGVGAGVARPEQLAGKSGLETMQAMLRGELPFPPIAQTLDFQLLEVDLGRAVFQGTPLEKHLNPKLRVSTILLTMFDSRTNLAHQVADDVREHFPAEVLKTVIPRSVRISEAPSYGQSVVSYDEGSSGSLSYLEAAAEIAHRGAPT